MSLDILATLSVALLSSFSHCFGMCGGLNLALLQLHKRAKHPFFILLAYHSFRILAYVCLGLVFGLFSKLFVLLPQSLIFFILGCFMIMLGHALSLRGTFLAFFERGFFFELLRRKLLARLRGLKSVLVLGFLNGLMPCGLVYFYLALALAQKSLLASASIMLIFGLCTLPALFIFIYASRLLSQRLSFIYAKLAHSLIIIYGFYYLYLALKLSG